MKTSQTTTASASFLRRADIGRQITSEHINEHLAAFEASGGVVEVLGNTPLQRDMRREAPAKPRAKSPAA